MLCDLFCQAFRESGSIKEVLFFLRSFNFYYGKIFLGNSDYCDSIFKIQNISVVTDSRKRDPRCTLLKQ